MSSVMGVFSEPRVNGMADGLGIIPGAAMDLTSVDTEDGMAWEAKCKKALHMVSSKRAPPLIGSPMRKAFSKLMDWNWEKWIHKRVRR